MNLYKTFDQNGNSPAVWTGSKTDASKAKTEMTQRLKDAAHPHRDVTYKSVEVPTKKEDLLAFLNGAENR